MATEYIYKICSECRGDAIIDRTSVNGSGNPVEADQPCPNCLGGLVLWGEIRDELIGAE